MRLLMLHQRPPVMVHLITIPTLHWHLLIRMLLPQVHIEIGFAPQQRVTYFALKFGRRFRMLLHDVHLQRAVLGEASLAMRALVRLLARVGEFVSLQMERIGKCLATYITAERSLARVGAKVPPQFGYFNRCIITQCTLERFLVCMLVPSVPRQFTTRDKSHLAVWLGTLCE
jgi:hypothetical protein